MIRVGMILLCASLMPALVACGCMAIAGVRRQGFRFTLAQVFAAVLASALLSAIVGVWFRLIWR
jgi:hypothetical protein